MNRFRVLCVWPPSVPTYFNAGHRLPLWEVAAYLARECPGADIETLDAGVLNYTWKEMADRLVEGYDVLFIGNEFDNVDAVARLARYARAISPSTRILTLGRASGVIPRFFCRYPLDAIIAEGDFEVAALDFIAAVRGTKEWTDTRGLLVRVGETWSVTQPGTLLDAAEWAFPRPGDVPVDAYTRISERPENRFSALPRMREWTIAVARGCPVGCRYCVVPMYQGLRERRRSVDAIIAHIEEARRAVAFDYVSMYAPTFTLHRRWIVDLCEKLRPLGQRWKCCTTIRHLDEELVRRMGDAGCVRISVGLETLDAPAQAVLPRQKRVVDPQLAALAAWCASGGIELNCFVMVGMPGQSAEGLLHTFETVRGVGARIRPTLYTPYDEIHDGVSEEELTVYFTRQIAAGAVMAGIPSDELYRLEFAPDAFQA